jgi:archaellum component FlaC
MALKAFRSRTTASLLVAALVLSACQTTSESARPLTPAEQQLRAEADTFNQTVAGGVATGAVAGALIGALAMALSGNNEDCGRDSRGRKKKCDNDQGSRIMTGAAVGAVAGGVLGGLDGYMTAKAQENGNNKVRMLNAMTEDAKKDTERLKRMVASSEQVLADSKDRLERIKSDVAAKKLTVAQANAERSQIAENQELLKKTLDNAVEKRDTYKQASGQMRSQGGDTREMDAKIAEMEKQVKELEENLSSLNTALEVTRVG